jgi:hypothetical protein
LSDYLELIGLGGAEANLLYKGLSLFVVQINYCCKSLATQEIQQFNKLALKLIGSSHLRITRAAFVL